MLITGPVMKWFRFGLDNISLNMVMTSMKTSFKEIYPGKKVTEKLNESPPPTHW